MFGRVGSTVGRALGATKSVAGRARSSGGRAVGTTAQATQRVGSRMSGFGARYAAQPATARVPGARSVGRGVAATGNFMMNRPKTAMGIGAAGLGYAGYRSTRGSQNSPIIGIE